MAKTRSILGAAALATSLLSAACGSESSGADASVAFLEPTLDNIQEYIFDEACSQRGCHAAGSPGGGLDLSTADASFAALVNGAVVNSVANQNGWVLVKPGDPELSFLVRKIGVPGLGEGAPMPYEEKLHPFYIALIEDWITAGAPR
jgi:hypothetical protein